MRKLLMGGVKTRHPTVVCSFCGAVATGTQRREVESGKPAEWWTVGARETLACSLECAKQVVHRQGQTLGRFTVSHERNRLYLRAFDHDEAVRLHNANPRRWSPKTLAEHFDVSRTAVERVLDVTLRQRMAEQKRRRLRGGKCEKCGMGATLEYYRRDREAEDGKALCRKCRGEAQRKLAVEMNGVIYGHCYICKAMLPLAAFPPRIRRLIDVGRGTEGGPCTSCETKKKRKQRAEAASGGQR